MQSIRGKLMSGFGLMLLFIIGQSAVTYFYFQNNESLVRQAINQDFKASTEIAKIAVAGQQLRRYEKEYFIYVDNVDKRRSYSKKFNDSSAKLKAVVDGVLNDRTDTWSFSDKQEVRRWKEALDTYGRGFNEVTNKVERGEIATTLGANAAIQDAKNAFRTLLKGAAKGGDAKYQNAEATRTQIAKNLEIVNYVLIAASAAGIVLVLVLMLTIPGSISKPIEALNEAAMKMSTGDLDQKVPSSGTVEFKDLAKTLERMRISQKLMVDQLKKKADLQSAITAAQQGRAIG